MAEQATSDTESMRRLPEVADRHHDGHLTEAARAVRAEKRERTAALLEITPNRL